MFAKGPRFPPVKPSDAPGPGYYKIPDEFTYESYKKGAFLEKADRFTVEKDSDASVRLPTYNTDPRDGITRAGPSKPLPSNVNLIHLQQQIENLKSQMGRLQKESDQANRKYEDKLMHNESTIKSLVKDNLALQSQLSAQQKENRLVCRREMTSRAALEKVETTNKSHLEQVRKYAALQRKLEELQKLHADERCKRQCEIDHITGALDSSRKTATELREQSSMLRKQFDASDVRVKDLKKAIAGDQVEIKELRAKLRDAEQVKNQLTSCQSDLDQLKKALQISEAKRKVECDDREAKSAQQEKNLVVERRWREASELRFREAQSQMNAEVKEVHERHRRLEAELESIRQSADEASSAATNEAAQSRHLRTTIARVTEAYGNLAASSVPRAAYRELQLQCASLHLRSIRLERRLADREAIAEQLTEYCRQASEEKAVLTSLLQNVERDLEASSHGCVSLENDVLAEYTPVMYMAFQTIEEAFQLHESIARADVLTVQAFASLYRTELEELLVTYMAVHRESLEESAMATRLVNALSEHQIEAEALRSECRTAQATLSRQNNEIAEYSSRVRVSEGRFDDLKRESARLEDVLKKERDANARLIHAAHQNKKNEDVLRSEINGIVEELQDALHYKEAHSHLLSEVVELIQRNELAEAEAERLSKFNAEILGHTNPQQKIFYVDRIRRELADTKHRLMKSTRSREDLMADNAALQHEVAAYKSIAVPVEYKPRNDRIRVDRPPLVPRNINSFTQDFAFELTPPDGVQVDTSPMTLDEIM